MFGKVAPEKTIRFMKTCSRMGTCLSPPANAGNFKLTRYKIHWWFNFCLSLSISLPIMYDMYLHGDDVNSILLNAAGLCPICAVTVKMLICEYYKEKLQACILEMENFLKTATLRERDMLQHYVDRCIGFYYFMLVCIFFTILGFSTSPLYLPQPYVAHMSYPFEVNTESLKNTLLAIQVVAVTQTGLFVALDFQFSALVWFTAARFELLSEEFRAVSNIEELCICIKKHQVLLRFADDVNLISRFIGYGIAFSTAIGSVCGGIQFLQDVSAMVKIRFVSFVSACTFQILGFSWSAQQLLDTSESIGFSAYASGWIGQSAEMAKIIFIVMQRAEKSAVISIGTFVPRLSLDFYGSFLSTSFSYFTALRATVTKSDA